MLRADHREADGADGPNPESGQGNNDRACLAELPVAHAPEDPAEQQGDGDNAAVVAFRNCPMPHELRTDNGKTDVNEQTNVGIEERQQRPAVSQDVGEDETLHSLAFGQMRTATWAQRRQRTPTATLANKPSRGGRLGRRVRTPSWWVAQDSCRETKLPRGPCPAPRFFGDR